MLVWDKALFDEMYVFPVWSHGVRVANSYPSFHYHYSVQKPRLESLVNRMMALPGFASLNRMAILGGGFGWTAELLAPHGVDAVSIDTSDYIIANESVSEEAELRDAIVTAGHDPDDLSASIVFMSDVDPNAELTNAEIWAKWLRPDGVRTSIPVLQEDLSGNASRNTVRKWFRDNLGGNPNAILTEYLLDSMENDAESLVIAERAEQLRPNPAATVVHLISGSLESDPRLNNKTGEDWRTLVDAAGFTDHWIVNSDGTTF